MKKLVTVLSLLFLSVAAYSAVTLTETAQVTLRVGSTNKATHPTMDACKADALARIKVEAETRTSGKATYLCRDERYQFVATFSPSPPPPPTCPPPPASSTRTQQCPAGTTGTWTQTSTSTVGASPACTVSTTWAPSSPPAGACTATPPPTPPSGDTIRNGQPFVISGSGFGTKPTAAPVVFDDFESGSGQLHNKPAVVGTWGSGEHSAPTYDTTQPLQGAKVARHAFGSGVYNASLYVDRAGTTYYLDYWMRLVPRSGTYSRNFKPWRIYGANDRSWANDVVFCDSPGWVGTDWGLGDWIPHPEFQRSPVIPRQHGIWEHYRVAVKIGPGAVFSQHRNGVLDVSRTGNQTTANAQGVRIGHYWALDAADDGSCKANSGADVYTDLVYVDTSLARVYLADAPTLAKAKHTAIQIPTAWADAAVTVTANTHGFKAGQAAHVIVVDASNVERKSLPVVVQQ